MASWQLESLSGKKNGSSGASTSFSISAALAGGDLLSLRVPMQHDQLSHSFCLLNKRERHFKCHSREKWHA